MLELLMTAEMNSGQAVLSLVRKPHLARPKAAAQPDPEPAKSDPEPARPTLMKESRLLMQMSPAQANVVFHEEVEEDHGAERALMYREMLILLGLALFVAIRAAIL
ncbi:MAG: hypothetical protein HKN29_15780 [Rhodothermales bacterium]|nr:hypothetical protein [Rhodothermales bacterium]